MSNVPVDPRVKQDMSAKLSAFERIAKRVAGKVARAANTDHVLREALHTHAVAPDMLTEQYNNIVLTGNTAGYTTPGTVTATPIASAQTGNFAVFAIPNEAGKTRYDVVNMTTQQKLVGNLHIAEGANTMVKLMNRGYSFYSPQIKSILDLENVYTKHYQDAVSFSRKFKSGGAKDMILETRFNESKLKANEAKQKLLEFVQKI